MQKYKVFLDSGQPSLYYQGVFRSVAEAWASVVQNDCGSCGSRFPRSWYCVGDAETGEIVSREPPKRLGQALRRATPEGKAKEAAASRRSYWRKKLRSNGSSFVCSAELCTLGCHQARAAGLPLGEL